MRILRSSLDLLYPRQCCECGRDMMEGDEQGLCWDCRADSVPLEPPWCESCGGVVAGRLDHAFTCADCTEHPPVYDRARSLYRYEGGVRTAIHALKYRRDFSVIPDLSRLLLAGIEAHFPEADDMTLVPVPRHRKRIRHRGFNQGEELIRGIRRIHKHTRVWTGLRRIKNTETQTRLSKAARRKNVRSAFSVPKAVDVPCRVLLIDDVMTTGATLSECSKVLKRAGVQEVYTLTLARG
ncbi:MAG: ComF family protein [Kiritimatiellae bacterium]|jgi:ComF family protein|nr:ComF family protein [Kiritimatiellia bacterium]